MSLRSETILLLEPRVTPVSPCARALAALGYDRVYYADFSCLDRVSRLDEVIDAVVAVWTDYDIAPRTVQRTVTKAMQLPHARGAMIVSPFSTGENADLFRASGARGWVRYPFTKEQFDQRLQHLLVDRRRLRQPIVIERRRAPLMEAVPA